MWQLVVEEKVDLIVASESYQIREVDGYYMDQSGLVIINVGPECPFSPTGYEESNGSVAVEFAGFVFYSC